jgi:DNA-binding transcriptional LysR family regulator
MAQLQAALAPADFDPATSQRRFNIVAGAYAAAVLAPPLVQRLAGVAPGVELAVTGYSTDLLDTLDARQADFVVTGVISAPERFARETLVAEELAWVVSAGSPLARREGVDLKALAATPHIVVGRQPTDEDGLSRRGLVTRASWEDGGALDLALAAEGLTRRVAVTAPDTYSALAIAARSHMATLAPRRLAQAGADAGRLALIEPPYPSPPVEIGLLFLKDRLREPPIAWMRGLILEVGRGL